MVGSPGHPYTGFSRSPWHSFFPKKNKRGSSSKVNFIYYPYYQLPVPIESGHPDRQFLSCFAIRDDRFRFCIERYVRLVQNIFKLCQVGWNLITDLSKLIKL